jgi:hypothetical protein
MMRSPTLLSMLLWAALHAAPAQSPPAAATAEPQTLRFRGENGFVLTRNGNRDDVERGCGGSCAVRGGTLQSRRRFLPACP